jgi:tRNA pseudouridine13 synthase
MLQVPKMEKDIGIEVYSTKAHGIGGVIRSFPEDFVVEEVLVDGSHAKIFSTENPSQIVSRGRYLRCILVKRNWDTLLAVKRIAEQLGIDQDRIQIAGIKDAKAATAQHIAISRLTPEQLQKLKIKDITIVPKNYSNEILNSNSLLGNRFQITIRAIGHSVSTTQKKMHSIYEELSTLGGMPNFFGHQRFGTIRSITHQVGKALVLGDLEEAALTFLAQPSPHEHLESREARQQLKGERDWKKALQYFPRKLHYERLMLQHLSRRKGDYSGAFRKLPIKLRRLFIQAYQSYLFNRFLSRRMKKGISLNEPQIGDYLIKVDSQGLPTGEFTQLTSLANVIDPPLFKGRIHLAIPLIGFKQPLSSGAQGEIERKILETEQVTRQNFLVSCMPELRAPGELRPIIARITDFSINDILDDSGSIAKRKVTLSFMLNRSSYATVLLREFMKPKNLIKAGY